MLLSLIMNLGTINCNLIIGLVVGKCRECVIFLIYNTRPNWQYNKTWPLDGASVAAARQSHGKHRSAILYSLLQFYNYFKLEHILYPPTSEFFIITYIWMEPWKNKYRNSKHKRNNQEIINRKTRFYSEDSRILNERTNNNLEATIIILSIHLNLHIWEKAFQSTYIF